MSQPSVFSALRHGAFARYMTGECISMIGSWMQVAAQGWLLTTLTERADVLGWLNFTSTMPMLLLTLIGGRFADRYDKRVILFSALAVQLLSAVAIGWLVYSGQIQIWHIFVAAGMVGLATAFEMPAVSALVPQLVPKEDMAGAIAIDRSNFHATRLIGPMLFGLVVAAFDSHRAGAASTGSPTALAFAYFINASSFLALGVALLTIPIQRSVSAEEVTPGSQGIAEGIAYVRSDVPTRVMIGMMSSLTMFVSPFVIISMPFYAHYVLQLGAREMGFLLAISGIGSLAGSLVLLSIPTGRRSFALKSAAAAIFVALCGLAWATSFYAAAGFMILLTSGLSITFGLSNIVIQERAPDEMRGRVSSIASLSYFGVVVFSGVLITKAIAFFGMRPTLAGGAVGYALAAALLLWGRERLASAARESRSDV